MFPVFLDCPFLIAEPEAAAIYCKEYAVQKNEGAEGSNLQSFD
jgi:hypothetical protein